MRHAQCPAGLRRLDVVRDIEPAGEPSILLDHLSRLSDKHRAVLVLRFWADLPEAEIAKIVGVRPATFRSLTARALARLRKNLPQPW
ncbi:MAG: hypothetical protein M3527_08055 [Actinomycetota bacterium]|nr:hypothetical protein [Actinomycetota bacterium]